VDDLDKQVSDKAQFIDKIKPLIAFRMYRVDGDNVIPTTDAEWVSFLDKWQSSIKQVQELDISIKDPVLNLTAVCLLYLETHYGDGE
jgi:hypothetical protein